MRVVSSQLFVEEYPTLRDEGRGAVVRPNNDVNFFNLHVDEPLTNSIGPLPQFGRDGLVKVWSIGGRQELLSEIPNVVRDIAAQRLIFILDDSPNVRHLRKDGVHDSLIRRRDSGDQLTKPVFDPELACSHPACTCVRFREVRTEVSS